MSVLLLAELSHGELVRDATARAVNAARALGDVTVLVAGSAAMRAGQAAARIDGVARVLVAEDDGLDHALAEAVAALVVDLAKDYEHIVAPATSSASNIMPRVAALLDVMVIPSVMEVVDSATFKRPIYAGNAIQSVKSRDACKVITFRTASFEAAGESEPARVDTITVETKPVLSKWIADEMAGGERPELASASVVISGGRGVGSTEGFKLIEALADRLGAAIGASRAAVDSGYAPNDWQVGQTGKVVAPQLYVAIGISGAIQHVAGMTDAKIIVAINKDEEAPIFQIADYGLVADLFQAVPELTQKLS